MYGAHPEGLLETTKALHLSRMGGGNSAQTGPKDEAWHPSFSLACRRAGFAAKTTADPPPLPEVQRWRLGPLPTGRLTGLLARPFRVRSDVNRDRLVLRRLPRPAERLRQIIEQVSRD
jgi:hypothetical protein